jgi:hypothetical protein
MSGPDRINVEGDDQKLRYLKAIELFRDFTPAQLEPFHHTIRMASATPCFCGRARTVCSARLDGFASELPDRVPTSASRRHD